MYMILLQTFVIINSFLHFSYSSIDSINLELPYTTKLEAAKESEMKAGSIGSKALKKNAKLLSHAAKNSLKGNSQFHQQWLNMFYKKNHFLNI